MILVGITDLHEGADALAPALTKALGQTVHESLSRLRGAGVGPIVVGVHQERAQAATMAEALRTAGFTALTVDDEDFAREIESLIVRQFTFKTAGLFMVKAAGGEIFKMRPADIRLLIKGTGIVSHEVTEKTKEKQFSAGLAIATQGLLTSKTVEKTKVTEVQEREGFVHLYTASGRVIELRETRIDYSGLGKSKQPTRLMNFAQTVTQLKKFAPDALYDERLLTRNAQGQLLGPVLTPEDNLIHACALLAKGLLSG